MRSIYFTAVLLVGFFQQALAQVDTLCSSPTQQHLQFDLETQLAVFSFWADSLAELTGDAPWPPPVSVEPANASKSYMHVDPLQLEQAIEQLIALVAASAGPPCADQTQATDFDGNTYALVEIGNQCWFAENLEVEHYANGDLIPTDLSDAEWASATSGAQAVYANSAANLAAYGRLYNGYAAVDSRGLCPSGWHVPSDAEWSELETHLGMAADQLELNGQWRGTDQGDQLRDEFTPGFHALLAGARTSVGSSLYLGGNGFFWSSTGSGANSFYRRVTTIFSTIYRQNISKRGGYSVRCLKD